MLLSRLAHDIMYGINRISEDDDRESTERAAVSREPEQVEAGTAASGKRTRELKA
ncbi:hypothetical protein [Paenibacillus thiaminolyticus]|uniref:hypothetical protein n=1 Tax=Paenibacillus thiaminolyticus TaxID=49283 RepID=UPI0015FF8278|nr:hypothetical protein [Paenibacillus thiaminolyticus]